MAIVAVDDDGNILLVKQFRKPVEKELWRYRRGALTPGKTRRTAVRREMREETGYLPRKVERLGGFYSAPGYCTEYLYLYLATDLVHSPLQAEDTTEYQPGAGAAGADSRADYLGQLSVTPRASPGCLLSLRRRAKSAERV